MIAIFRLLLGVFTFLMWASLFSNANAAAEIFIKKSQRQITVLSFSPDGSRIVVGTRDGLVRIWSLADDKEISSFQAEDSGSVRSVAISPDGQRLAVAWLWCGVTIQTVEGMQARSDNKVELLRCERARVYPVLNFPGFLSDVRLFEMGTGKKLKDLLIDGPPVRDMAFSSDGRSLLTSHDGDGSFRRFSGDDEPVRVSLGDEESKPEVNNFSADGRSVITFGRKGPITLWEVATGKERSTIDSVLKEPWRVTLSPDGRFAAAVDIHHGVIVVDLLRRKTVAIHTPFSGQPSTSGFAELVAFAPRSPYLAITLPDNTVQVTDWTNDQVICVLKGHTDRVQSLVFSPDDKLLATGGADMTVRVWRLP